MIYTNIEYLTNELLNLILTDSSQYVSISFTKKPTNQLCQDINNKILASRKDIIFRLYGKGTEWINLDFLQYLTNLEILQFDPYKIDNLVGIEFLVMLKKLRIGFPSSPSFSIKNITELKNLKCLYIIGKITNQLDILSLLNLDCLFIDEFENLNINLISNMDNLKKLSITNGKVVKKMVFNLPKNLKYLNLSDINGFSELPDLTQLPDLTILSLSNIKKIGEIPDFTTCKNLTGIRLEKVSNLSNLKDISTIQNLEEFAFYKLGKQSSSNF